MLNSFQKNLYFLAGSFVANSDSLFRLQYLRDKRRKFIVTRKSDLCIEGFMRTGNGYVIRHLKKYNSSVHFAHHQHASAHVRLALKLNVPVLILIREPLHCIASLSIKNRLLNYNSALFGYIHFYKNILSVKEKVIISDFDDSINHTHKLIKYVNIKYGINLHSKPQDFNADKKWAENLKVQKGFWSPAPNEIKDKAKSKILTEIKNNSLFIPACDIYNRLKSFNWNNNQITSPN